MDSRYHGPCKANAFLSCQHDLPMSCISPPSYFHFPEKAVSVLGAYLRCWLSIAAVYIFCVFPVHLFRYFCGNLMQLAKLYKLKHLNKVEAVSSDNTGCSFVMVSFAAALQNPFLLQEFLHLFGKPEQLTDLVYHCRGLTI